MKTDSPKSVNIPRIVTGTAIFMLFTPLASFVLNSGSIIGMAFGAAMILSGVFPRKIKDAISEIKKKKGGSAVLKIIAAIFIIIAVYCTALTAIIMSFGANSRDIPTDTPAIVLGCKVNDEEPSLMLKKIIKSFIRAPRLFRQVDLLYRIILSSVSHSVLRIKKAADFSAAFTA